MVVKYDPTLDHRAQQRPPPAGAPGARRRSQSIYRVAPTCGAAKVGSVETINYARAGSCAQMTRELTPREPIRFPRKKRRAAVRSPCEFKRRHLINANKSARRTDELKHARTLMHGHAAGHDQRAHSAGELIVSIGSPSLVRPRSTCKLDSTQLNSLLFNKLNSLIPSHV